MQKNLKGGYKLISLALVDIELALVGTGATIKGIHESIEASYGKSLQLTGIVVDGVEKNDVRVAVEVVDGDYVIKDVYGYDLTIDGDDLVVATEHPSGAVTRDDIVSASGLVTPLVAPLADAIVGVGTNNAQKMIGIGAGLVVEDNVLKASGGIPTKMFQWNQSYDLLQVLSQNDYFNITISGAGPSLVGLAKVVDKQSYYIKLEIVTNNGLIITNNLLFENNFSDNDFKITKPLLPQIPSDASTKTYIPKLVNGTLQWVEETA